MRRPTRDQPQPGRTLGAARGHTLERVPPIRALQAQVLEVEPHAGFADGAPRAEGGLARTRDVNVGGQKHALYTDAGDELNVRCESPRPIDAKGQTGNAATQPGKPPVLRMPRIRNG